MANDNKSISTEEMEATTLENVSLEDNDIEQQKNRTPGNGNNAHSTKRRYVILASIGALLLLTALIVGLAVGLSGKKGSTTKSSANLEANENSETSSEDPSPVNPFGEVKLRGYASDIMEGYASVEEFEADLTKTAEYIVHNIIQWNIHHYNQNAHSDDEVAVPSVAMHAAVSASAASAAGGEDVATKKNSKNKNKNQEEDAEEFDIVQSDENYIYTSHGYVMLVMDHEGNVVKEVNSTVFNNEWGYHDSLYIRSILLTDEYVIMVSDGYDYGEESGLYDRNATHVTAYTKPTAEDPSMEKVGSQSFNGYFQDGRWMQDSNSIQILTAGSMRTWELIDQLSPAYFPWMSQEDYATKAAAQASKKLIPNFVKSVSRDVMMNGELPAMLRLNAWTKNDQTDSWKHFGEYFALEQFFSGYTQVTSFSVSELSVGSEMKGSASLFFSPAAFATLYGTDDNLVVAVSKSEWDEENQHAEESTFLLNMNIADDGGTEFHSITMLDGSLQSRYSLDVQGNDLRVATTIRKWIALDNVWASCGDNYYISEDTCMTPSIWDECMQVSLDCPRDKVVMTGCPYTISCDTNETTTEEDMSSTENYITVFDIEQKGEMTEVGRLRIGEPHEVITAVRFDEAFSYAMTFDQTDPFYVLKLDAGKAPAISGKVELHGFSTVLHMDADQSMLVGIGQNTSGTGLDQMNSGVLISIFDVSDPSNPVVVDSRMLDQGTTSVAEWDAKAATYADGKLIMPVSQYHYMNDFIFSDDHVMGSEANFSAPEMSSSDFDGFVVFDVTDGIEELFRVNHMRPMGTCSYCSSFYFSDPRSFLNDDGSLVTVSGQYMISTDLSTGEEIWKVEPHMKGDTKDCCW